MTFGEVCRFKNRSHEPASSGQVWHEGVFVGIDQRTGQYMIFSENGVKLARTVVRVPEVEKFSKEALAEVRATPWAFARGKEARDCVQRKGRS